jgi:hypothetical protein
VVAHGAIVALVSDHHLSGARRSQSSRDGLLLGAAALIVFMLVVLIIDGYRRTGRKLTIDGTNRPVLDDPSSFGYIVSHTRWARRMGLSAPPGRATSKD